MALRALNKLSPTPFQGVALLKQVATRIGIGKSSSSIGSNLARDKETNGKFSRYPTTNIKELPVATQEQMYNADDRSGFIPNIYHALAYRPQQFEAFIQYRNSIMKRSGSNLKKEDLELAGLAASLQLGCMYCIIAHSALHRSFSKDKYLADQIAADVRSADLSPRQRAIASLASAVAGCETIDDHHFGDLRKHGLSMDDAWDIASMASFTAMTSGMVKFLNVKPNHEYYAMGR